MGKVDGRTVLISIPVIIDWSKLPNSTFPPKITSVLAGSTPVPYTSTKINQNPVLCSILLEIQIV
jgi:hypothetical protein